MKLNRITSFLILVFLTPLVSFSQPPPFNTLGKIQSSEGQEICKLKNTDGYAILGSGDRNGKSVEFLLIRTNLNGDTLWTQTYGSLQNDYGTTLKETSDKGFILGGILGKPDTLGQLLSNPILIHTDSLGNELWTAEVDSGSGEGAYSVGETYNGDFFMAGQLNSNTNGEPNSFLACFNALGNMKWIKTYPTSRYTFSAVQTNDSCFLLAGTSNSFPFKPYLIKADSIGNVIWEKGNNWGVNSGTLEKVHEDNNGNILITGSSSGNIYVAKLNSIGNVIWHKTYGGNKLDAGKSVAIIRKTGGYAVAGTTKSFASNNNNASDIWLLRLDNNGDTLWTNTYGTNENDEANDILEDNEGNLIITGSLNNGLYAYLLRTDSLGNPLDSALSVAKHKGNNPIDMSVYPNPASSELFLEFKPNTFNKNITIEITDVNGKVLKTFNYSGYKNFIQLDIASLSVGVYLVEVTGSDFYTNRKFIKN